MILQLPAAGATPWALRAGAAVGVVCASWWFVAARARGQFKPVWDAGLAAALFAAAIGVGEPLRALGLFYGAIYLRAFYGPSWRVALTTASFFVALLAASAISGDVASPDVLMQLPSFALSAAVTHLLSRTLVAPRAPRAAPGRADPAPGHRCSPRVIGTSCTASRPTRHSRWSTTPAPAAPSARSRTAPCTASRPPEPTPRASSASRCRLKRRRRPSSASWPTACRSR